MDSAQNLPMPGKTMTFDWKITFGDVLTVASILWFVSEFYPKGSVSKSKNQSIFAGDFAKALKAFRPCRDWMPAWAQGVRIEDIRPSFDVFTLGKLLWSLVSGQPKLRLMKILLLLAILALILLEAENGKFLLVQIVVMFNYFLMIKLRMLG
jgi:hypothetical protein